MSVTEPGIYKDMPADEYLADPVPGGSLSQSGTKLLLPPHTPAHYRWSRDNPRETTAAFRLGHAAHRVVLGAGPELFCLEHTDMRTKAAKEERAAIEDNGGIALTPDKYDTVVAMAKAIRAHPLASKMFDPAHGSPEQSMFWQDNGIWRRGRLDWLPNPDGGRLVIPDYKTADSAHEDKFQRSMADYGYHQQAAWYIDGVRELLGAGADTAFVFVVQEKTPPYLVNVIEPDPIAVKIGRYLNRKALAVFAHCQKTGKWPGYPVDVERVRLPYFIENEYESVLTST